MTTLALLALSLLLFLFFPDAPDTHPSQSIVRSIDQKTAQVRIQAIMDRNHFEDDSPGTLQFTVQNDSAQPIANLSLALSAPGFAIDQSNLVCEGVTTQGPDRQLLPQASCHCKVDLLPAARSGSYGVTVYANWNQAHGAQRASLLVGPVGIDRAWGAARWTLAFRRLGNLLKDLTLPLLLAGLGAVFASRQSDREAQRRRDESQRETDRAAREKKMEEDRIEAERLRQEALIAAEKEAEKIRIAADRAREEARRIAEAEEAERQEVRRLLLERVMALAEQHYLPFVGIARLILNEADKIATGRADASAEKLFFQVLLLLRRMETFKLTKGGIFFSSRDGERAVGAAWYLLRIGMYAALGDAEVAQALKVVKSDWDYATYLAEFPKLDALWKKFQAWLAEPLLSTALSGSFWQILGTVDAFQAVMAFEADKALTKYWYDNEQGRVEFRLTAPTVLYDPAAADLPFKKQIAELGTLLHSSFGRPVTILPIP
ncbi:MAG TPA: hypothetical protein VGJ21_16400 [Terracidiphilus sp.]